MHEENGDKCGFLIRRNSWNKNFAKIVSIDNEKVLANIYENDTFKDVTSEWTDSEYFEITCPMTHSYSLIEDAEISYLVTLLVMK